MSSYLSSPVFLRPSSFAGLPSPVFLRPFEAQLSSVVSSSANLRFAASLRVGMCSEGTSLGE